MSAPLDSNFDRNSTETLKRVPHGDQAGTAKPQRRRTNLLRRGESLAQPLTLLFLTAKAIEQILAGEIGRAHV